MSSADLTGNVYWGITVIGKSSTIRDKTILWDCICSCGNTLILTRSNLEGTDYWISSCGCKDTEDDFQERNILGWVRQSVRAATKRDKDRGLTSDITEADILSMY